MGRFLRYWLRMVPVVLKGDRAYYGWVMCLAVFIALGGWSYYHHVTEGLIVTNMSDQVSWGIGIANFVYFVGVAAAAAILVVPAYIYKRQDIKHVVLFGELMAVVAVIMCLLFICSDIGHPERMWHLFPPFGMMNLPSSLLAWDVLVFSGYLTLNIYIPGYLLYMEYLKREPRKLLYVPLVLVSIVWAVSIHTVTAFLLSGLGSRPFWNSAILAPRFLISAGASGPAILYIVFTVIRTRTAFKIEDSVLEYLKTVLRITMPVNLFLLGCEVFLEFYTGSLHAVNAKYLYFGLHGHTMLPKFIWTAIVLNVSATVLYLWKKTRANHRAMLVACGLTITGVWLEKGMGLIFPGFTPSPLGEIVEYAPNLGEIAVCLGVLALGMLMFTVFVKVTIAIQTGELVVSYRDMPWLTGGAAIEASLRAQKQFEEELRRRKQVRRKRRERPKLPQVRVKPVRRGEVRPPRSIFDR